VVFASVNNWFQANLLSLNFGKTSLIQFLAKNSSHISIGVDCHSNIESNITNIKFFGIMSGNTLMWKSHVEIIIPELTVACVVVRTIETFVQINIGNSWQFSEIMIFPKVESFIRKFRLGYNSNCSLIYRNKQTDL